jgi:Kef-type K+ transport system membrane component KefB
MLAGILLGPSLLGWLAPGMTAALFPESSLGVLSALSQVGMVLFMFLVGMELDSGALRERGEAAILISHASIVIPFALGATLALPLYPRFAPPGIAFFVFALFLGAAMSVTAFPVLARILSERGLLRTPLGTLATSAAAVDDVTAWTILAAIVVITRAGGAAAPLWTPLLGIGVFVAVVYALRGPLRRRISAAFEGSGRLTHDQVAALVAVALAGASLTEAAGVHALFGAFFVGLVLSSERRVAEAARERLEGPLVVVLLPLYFAFTGLRTRLGLLTESGLLGWTALVFAVAIAGKLGGSAIAARA